MMPASSRRSSIGSRSSILGFKLRRSGLHNGNRGTAGQLSQDNVESGVGDGILKVPVIGYEVMEARERFTVYKLQIENEQLSDSWLVCRRYTDFERLAVKLKEEFPNLFINLPPKRWLKNNFDTTFLDDRMKGIQAFVDSILIQHQLASSPTVRTFFCLDEPPMYPENAEESRAMFGNVEESVTQLKEIINERDEEIEILKAQLEVSKLRNDVLTKKLNRACRACNHRRFSNSTLSSSGKIGEPVLPIQTSTPNLQGGSEKRARNRSSRSEASSIESTPKARLVFESPDRGSGSLGSLVSGREPTAQPETDPIPVEISATSSTSPPTNQSSLANYSKSEMFSTANSRILLTNGENSLNNGSPFEIISSSSEISKEMDRNSSFEVLSSPSYSELHSSKDSNHNSQGATATHR